MAYTFIQGVGKAESTTSIAQAFASPVTAGSTLFYVTMAYGDITSISDSLGNTITQEFLRVGVMNTNHRIAVYCVRNSLGGANTVTVTGASASRILAVIEASGYTAAGVYRSNAADDWSATPDSGTITNTLAGTFMIGAVFSESVVGPFSQAGWNEIVDAAAGPLRGMVQWFIGSLAGGTSRCQPTGSGLTGEWNSIIVSFLPGGPPPVDHYPTADISTGGWTSSSGSGSLASHIDETIANDADYIQSPASPTNDAVEIAVPVDGIPQVGTVSVMIRLRKV
jgi:hypothetical protein